MAPYLATLLEDPYPVVRYIAARSLKELPGFETFSYDYVATGPGDLRESRERALDIWGRTAKPEATLRCSWSAMAFWSGTRWKLCLKNRNDRPLELFE